MALLEVTIEGRMGEMSFHALADVYRNIERMFASADRAVHNGKQTMTAVVQEIRQGSMFSAVEYVPVQAAENADPTGVTLTVINGLEVLDNEDEPRIPPGFDLITARFAGAAAKGLNGGVKSAHLRLVESDFTVDPEYTIFPHLHRRVEVALKPRDTVWGSIEGVVDQISIRGKSPSIGVQERLEQRPLRCVIDKASVDQARDALGHRVVVTGAMSMNASSQVVKMMAEKIDLVPDDSDLPTIGSIAGKYPGFIEGADPIEYVRALRGGE
ncbi:MAG TPA: hypothetical protein VNQ73_08850 [Ilumatobacter sp.]|nr:hypothetical protein [Ilumatobacter sp.]